MGEFIKKLGSTFYLAAVSLVFILVSFILAIVSSSTQGFEMSTIGGVITSIIIALVAVIAGTYCSYKFGPHHYISAVVNLVAVVLCVLAFGLILVERVTLASSLLTYDASNAVGWKAFTTSVVAMILLLISPILLTVNAFKK